MSLTCVRDEDTDGLPSGQELFQLEGQPSPESRLGWQTEGSGTNITLPTLNSYDIINNRDFELFDNINAPVGWTLSSGVVGTDLEQETNAGNVHRGFSAMKFTGTGTDIDLRQNIGINSLQPNRQYMIALPVMGSATIDGDFTVEFHSDSGDYVAGATEKIELDSTAMQALSGGYEYQTAYVMMPPTLPDDLQLRIRLEGSTTGELFLDSLAVGPIVYGNGVGVAVVAGETQWAKNDRITFQIQNAESVWQAFMRRWYRLQLPSDAAPTIADSLAV